MEASPQQHALIPYRVYVIVWAALVLLTTITVGAHYTELGHVAILTAIVIATVKVSLVMLYFMHLRFAPPVLIAMVFFVLGNYAVFVALTFTDYLAR